MRSRTRRVAAAVAIVAGAAAGVAAGVLGVAVVAAAVLPGAVHAQGVVVFGGGEDEIADPEERAELIIKLIEDATRRSSSTTSVLAGVDLARAPAATRRAARVIRTQRVSFAVDGMDVESVIDLLRQLSGLNFTISRRAREALAEEGRTVSLELRNLPLENVLNLVAMQLGDYRFTIRYGAVMLVRKEEYHPKLILKIYDIRDLLHEPRDFRAPKLGLSGVTEER